MNTDPLLRAREGAAWLNISEPSFWRRVADGTIPKPIKLGTLSRWPQSEIDAVVENAKVARSEQHGFPRPRAAKHPRRLGS